MANKPLQSITFPELDDKYTVPVVDNTLTTTGAAADAKKTGDEITSIKEDLSHLITVKSLSALPFENGSVDTNGLNASTVAYRLRSKNYIPVEPSSSVKVNFQAGYDVYYIAWFYTVNDYTTNAVGKTDGWSNSENLDIPAGVNYVRLVLSKNNGATSGSMSPSDIAKAAVSFTLDTKDYVDDVVGENVNTIHSDIKNFLIDDVNNVFTKLSDGTTSKKVKFAEGCIIDGIIDTTPRIDLYDKGMADATVGDKIGACITALYPVNVEHTYTVYRANANNFSFSGYYSCQKFKDDVYVRYASFPSTANTAQTLTFTGNDKSEESGINQIRFTLIAAEVKDSYMYDNVTGEVVFAGSNTQYYGKKYIDGHVTDSTIITDKNIEEMGLGLIIGKDGAAHLSIDDLAIQGDGIKFADNAVEDALYETKPRIAEYGVRGYGDSVRDVYDLTCITEKYKMLPGHPKVTLYQAVASGTSISWNGRNVVSYYTGNTYRGYVSISASLNTEGTVKPNTTIAALNPDSFFVNLVTASVDDSYAYEPDTGYIYFAGKNTAYYGKKTIYDTDTTTGLDSLLVEINDTVKYLRNDNHDMIPFILFTDQHSLSIASAVRAFARRIDSENYCKMINLGDVVADHWEDADQEHPFFSDSTLEEFAQSVEQIPVEKRISIFGNHDTWWKDGSTSKYKAPQNHLYKYFKTGGIRRIDNYGNFTVIDDKFNVKFICPSGYMYTGAETSYTTYELSSDTIDWIIDELSENDGYDIIVLSHQSIAPQSSTYDNPVKGTTGTIQSIAVFDYSPIWIARKNKTSGTIIDAYGLTHTYDFTGCKTDLICSLHGHQHNDGVYYIGDVLCNLIFQCYSKVSSETVCYYLLIDRQNQQANIWRINTLNNTYTNYQIPFTPETEGE